MSGQAAMDRLLRGEIRPGAARTRCGDGRRGGCRRTRRLQALQDAGEIPDPREAQVARLKAENSKLKERFAQSEQTIDALTDFRAQALARLAAQHEEIVHLRQTTATASRVARLPAARSSTTVIGTCS
ncbi:hypothetical protein PV691_32160 [Streptomyces sp. AK08-01A]|uniref:hypothetical protein n=1 Tax=Streptomyces sp. AK08-01B TaxID=3028653 RepID=UPI0029A531A5|nr:hypothetical protein [Streptomyces sp. AK08-01B]MDX3819841.1 hypothetical protein [Streptomyces sp. AK08-01A]